MMENPIYISWKVLLHLVELMQHNDLLYNKKYTLY